MIPLGGRSPRVTPDGNGPPEACRGTVSTDRRYSWGVATFPPPFLLLFWSSKISNVDIQDAMAKFQKLYGKTNVEKEIRTHFH